MRKTNRTVLVAALGATVFAVGASSPVGAASTVGSDIPVAAIAAKALQKSVSNPRVSAADGESVAASANTEVKVSTVLDTNHGSTEVMITPEGSVSSEKSISYAAFMASGVVRWGGYKFTYYSQRVLPGPGLRIPGRHVNANGYVCDADGYIVLAGSAAKGTIYPTPFGAPGKVYDRGTHGNHLDVYVK